MQAVLRDPLGPREAARSLLGRAPAVGLTIQFYAGFEERLAVELVFGVDHHPVCRRQRIVITTNAAVAVHAPGGRRPACPARSKNQEQLPFY